MTNDERDKMIRTTHDAVLVMVKQVGNHETTLYGNGKPGLTESFALLQERQEQCPARKAITIEGKRLNIATWAIALATISLLANIALSMVNK